MSPNQAAPTRRRGRPKNARNKKTIVRAIALERHAVKVGAQVVVMNTVQYVLHVLQAKMMAGDLRAQEALEALAVKLGETDGHGVLIAPADIIASAWIAHEEEQNARRKPPMKRDDEDL